MREVILARRLEQEISKDEILELYLNHIYFGHGRYGIEEAARYLLRQAGARGDARGGGDARRASGRRARALLAAARRDARAESPRVRARRRCSTRGSSISGSTTRR